MNRGTRSGRLIIWAMVATVAAAAGGASAADPRSAPGAKAWDCPYGGPGAGYGMGPGMMGGYGMGPGMMGGYGMGPGMMGGYGMGPGMMGAYRGAGLELSDKQRAELNAIQDETRKQHWSTMGEMMDEQARLRDLYDAEKPDNTAIEESYKRLGELQQKMYRASIEAHKRMDALLTDEQRQQMRKLWRRGPAPAN